METEQNDVQHFSISGEGIDYCLKIDSYRQHFLRNFEFHSEKFIESKFSVGSSSRPKWGTSSREGPATYPRSRRPFRISASPYRNTGYPFTPGEKRPIDASPTENILGFFLGNFLSFHWFGFHFEWFSLLFALVWDLAWYFIVST